MGERNKHFARIRDMAVMPIVAQTSRCLDQLRERGLLEADKKRVIARIAHRNHLMRLSGMRPRHVGCGPRMMLYLYDVASLRQMQSSREQDAASPSGAFREFE